MLARNILRQAAAVGRFGHDSAARLEIIFAELVRAGSIRMSDGSLRISLAITQDTLANAICTSREYVGRLIQILESVGDLRRHNGWYIIPRSSRIMLLVNSLDDTLSGLIPESN
jgi:CRP-like cAMP-binding protein